VGVNKINGIAYSAIAKVSGKTPSQISKISGETASGTPAPTVTLWGCAGADGGIGWATGSSPTTWAGYRSPNTKDDHVHLGYGKDGSGGNIWVRTTSNNNNELAWTDDIQTDGTWNLINVSGRRFKVKWANDKWIAVGQVNQSDILTSSDGASWGSVDISGLSGFSSTSMYGLATNGTSSWIITQNDRVYGSTDHGASWNLINDFNDSSKIWDAVYSTGYWFVFRTNAGGGGSNAEKISRAPVADWTSWTSTSDTGIGAAAKDFNAAVSTASADYATVIVVNSNDIVRSTDSGATYDHLLNVLPYGSARACAGDGQGNWVATHDDGRVSYSNDDGATWAIGSSEITFDSGTEDIDTVAVNKYLPL